ncbi:MAG: hypothetical protein OXM56_13100 [Gammaproteobacteria bacterium]|nr:hypothetical protein [Gammaproteobacteria bacterium]
MSARPWMSTSLLVAAVTWGGVACACGTASLAAEPASVHAMHHGDGEPAYADCERIDCDGDCVAQGLVPERAPTPLDPSPASPDDGAGVPALLALPAFTPLGPRSHSPPVPAPWRAADTPVRRFDLLLN